MVEPAGTKFSRWLLGRLGLAPDGDPRVFRVALLAVLYVAVGVCSLPPRLLRGAMTAGEVVSFSAVLVGASLVLWALRRGRDPRWLAWVELLLGAGSVLFETTQTGGLFSPSMTWLVFLPTGVVVLVGVESLVWGGLLALVIFVVYAVAHGFGLLGPARLAAVYQMATLLSMLTLVSTLLLWLFVDSEQRARRAQGESTALFLELSQRLLAGAVFLDGHTIVFATPVAAELLGVPLDGLIGRDFFHLTAVSPSAVESVARRSLEGQLREPAVEFSHGEGARRRRLGARFGTAQSRGREVTLVTLVDVTVRSREDAERLALQSRLMEAERLESMGRIAGGVAHDFNNLLVSVMGNAELLATSPEISSGDRALVADIQIASERAAGLVRQLLAYAGRGRATLKAVRLEEAVRDSVRLVESGQRGAASLDVRVLAPGVSVWADDTQLGQVIGNLLHNAIDAVREAPQADRRVEVSLDLREVGADELAMNTIPGATPPPGRYAELVVRDAGVGISEEDLKRLFEPFFTRKTQGHGLGLSAVQGIVKRHGGAILVESHPGRGTAFTVLLPAAPEREAGRERHITPGPLLNVRPRVLVVDDDMLVRKQIVRVLERGGCEVTEREDGASALALLRDKGGPAFDVVLVDQLMPGFDGVETTLQIQQLDRGLPVVLCSGTVDADAVEQVGFAAVLSKPFHASVLLRTVVTHARASEDRPSASA